MTTPDFVLALRRKVGHDPLPMTVATCVVFDDDGRVLLGRRADNRQWNLVSGIIEPGEQPAAGARREIEEETGVIARVERLLGVEARDLLRFPNGDQVWTTSIIFRCRHVSGDARVNDDESTEVGWFALDELPDLPPHHAHCLALAGENQPAWFRP